MTPTTTPTTPPTAPAAPGPRPSTADKRRQFHALHRSGCFVLPNPWDLGSARWLQGQGFAALASTSSGLAWSLGRADNALPRDVVLQHLADLAQGLDVPLNADFENGFGRTPAELADSVRLAVATGVAGLSIEDSTGDPAHPLFSVDEAVQRMQAARRAIDASGGDTLLVGRAECFLNGRPDLDETIARLQAYANAGADCLYAPGIRTPAQIRAVVDAVAPKPVNLLLGWAGDMTVADAAALGVRRISLGGGLARAAWGALQRTARLLAEGRFDGLADAASGAELNRFFAADSQ